MTLRPFEMENSFASYAALKLATRSSPGESILPRSFIHNLHNTIMQSVLGGSLHKSNTSYLPLGLYHASGNRISIVLVQITPQDERYYGICASRELAWKVCSCILHYSKVIGPSILSLSSSVSLGISRCSMRSLESALSCALVIHVYNVL